jgi:hypothetical protein
MNLGASLEEELAFYRLARASERRGDSFVALCPAIFATCARQWERDTHALSQPRKGLVSRSACSGPQVPAS